MDVDEEIWVGDDDGILIGWRIWGGLSGVGRVGGGFWGWFIRGLVMVFFYGKWWCWRLNGYDLRLRNKEDFERVMFWYKLYNLMVDIIGYLIICSLVFLFVGDLCKMFV